MAVKRQLQLVNTGFETKLEQSITRTQGIVDELASQMVDRRSELEATISKLDQDVSRRFTRQRESIDQIYQEVNQEKSATQRRFEQVNAKIVTLESKIADAPSRTAVAEESRATCNILLSPSVVNHNGPSSDNDGTTSNNAPTNENHACSCQSANTCNICVRASGNTTGMNVLIESLSVSSFLSSSELSLLLFDDNSDTIPVFHLRRLDTFIRLEGVPKTFQLVVVYRSIVAHMSKQGIETVSRNLTDYEAFKSAFLNTWWSASLQNLVKCSLYQDKYNRNSNLTLSGHFLKYATKASHLEPRPTDYWILVQLTYRSNYTKSQENTRHSCLIQLCINLREYRMDLEFISSVCPRTKVSTG
jgi:hypothetical protein